MAVVAPVSTGDRLKAQLLSKYDTHVRPNGLTEVWTVLEIDHVDYAPETSTLTTRASLTMRWLDTKLRWNPDEFEDRHRVVLADSKQYEQVVSECDFV